MIEVFKRALDALEAQGLNVDGSAQLAVRAKYELRQAIAELESQEPVADDFFRMIADRNPKPFPPKRTWVGLTDEEMLMIYGQDHVGKKYSLGRMVQQALKEKNT